MNALGLAAMLLVLGMLVGCGKPPDAFPAALERSVVAQKGLTNSSVTISAITDFEWDSFFVFGPYTPPRTIQAKLGFAWADADKTGIEWSDTFNLLVFVNKGEVVRWFKIARGVCDFYQTDSGKEFPRGKDRLWMLAVGTNANGTTRWSFSATPKP